MIFKVQLSIWTPGSTRKILIYNQNKGIAWEGDVSEEVLSLMDGRLIAFFDGDVINTKIELRSEVPKQDW